MRYDLTCDVAILFVCVRIEVNVIVGMCSYPTKYSGEPLHLSTRLRDTIVGNVHSQNQTDILLIVKQVEIQRKGCVIFSLHWNTYIFSKKKILWLLSILCFSFKNIRNSTYR